MITELALLSILYAFLKSSGFILPNFEVDLSCAVLFNTQAHAKNTKNSSGFMGGGFEGCDRIFAITSILKIHNFAYCIGCISNFRFCPYPRRGGEFQSLKLVLPASAGMGAFQVEVAKI